MVAIFKNRCNPAARFRTELLERDSSEGVDSHNAVIRSKPHVRVVVPDECENLELRNRGRQGRSCESAAIPEPKAAVGSDPQAAVIGWQQRIDGRITKRFGYF